MKTLGTKEMAIASLKLPGDWKKRLESQDTQNIAATASEVGILQEPMVRKSDSLLVFGTGRTAAWSRLGHETIVVKLVDCTDLEVKLLRKIENSARTHDVQGARAGYLELLELITEREQKKNPEELPIPAPNGQRKTPRGRARAELADKLQVKPESIRQAERRARRRKEAEEKPRPAKDLPIDPLGQELDPKFVADVEALQKYLSDAAVRLSAAQSTITIVQNKGYPVHGARLTRIKDQLAEVGSALRSLIPSSLCPFCKGIDQVQKVCGGCESTGYITKDQERQVPKELWDEEKPLVFYRGEQKPLSAFLEPEEEAAPSPWSVG